MMSAMTQTPEPGPAPSPDIELSSARYVRTLRVALTGGADADTILSKLEELQGGSWRLTEARVEEDSRTLVLTFAQG
jgi:hypothetical protein